MVRVLYAYHRPRLEISQFDFCLVWVSNSKEEKLNPKSAGEDRIAVLLWR
jgi:hypothetical protein